MICKLQHNDVKFDGFKTTKSVQVKNLNQYQYENLCDRKYVFIIQLYINFNCILKINLCSININYYESKIKNNNHTYSSYRNKIETVFKFRGQIGVYSDVK